MSEMTDDPALGKLARFTPDRSSLDPAEILFRAGRESARPHRGWKLACSGLLLAILALVGERVVREAGPPNTPPPGPREDTATIAAPPIAAPPPEPGAGDAGSLWSFGALLRASDPKDFPRSAALAVPSPTDPPLTPRSRGEFD